MSDPHLRMTELSLTGPVPKSMARLAALATDAVIADVVNGRLTFLVLITFKDAAARLWQLHDTQPADDVARAIIAEEEPEAIAFVYPMPLPPEVRGERGYNVAVEAPGGRYESLIALWGGEGPGGEMMQIYARPGEGKPHRWFGVPPEAEIVMWMEGVVGMVGPKGEA